MFLASFLISIKKKRNIMLDLLTFYLENQESCINLYCLHADYLI